jgi:hypothetical protein
MFIATMIRRIFSFFLFNQLFFISLPWQRAQTSRSIIFKSYTLIGTSYLPCQDLCSAVRYCAGVQYQVKYLFYINHNYISIEVRGAHRNRCRLLRSANPWDLVSSKTWTVFVKRLCHVQINQIDIFSRDNKPLCNFKYFGQGQQ